MKIISRDDLLLILPMIEDRDNYSLKDFELLLNRFGDDWFIEGCKFEKTKENEEMKKIREKFAIKN